MPQSDKCLALFFVLVSKVKLRYQFIEHLQPHFLQRRHVPSGPPYGDEEPVRALAVQNGAAEVRLKLQR